MTDSCACGGDRDRRRLLAFLGAAMVGTGQPVHEVEDELREVGRHLGAPDVQVAAGPTGVHVGLASGDPATFESVDGRLRLDQAVDVGSIEPVGVATHERVGRRAVSVDGCHDCLSDRGPGPSAAITAGRCPRS